MRLLQTADPPPGEPELRLTEFFGEDIPKYAILSHTWKAGEEVLFSDVQNRSWMLKPGIAKVRGAIQQAKQHGYEYIWIDSCCIDKQSSAELSEAINSMYQWYKKAEVCYVYLPDVESLDAVPNWILVKHGAPKIRDWESYAIAKFRGSVWFRRGWTLQELLAPKRLFFYSTSWKLLGCTDAGNGQTLPLSDPSGPGIFTSHILFEQVSKATAIPMKVLDGRLPLQQVSVAEKMKWLASRKTTRPEDMAYCALGLFDVNIPLLYGEGSRAFIRLQEEIIRTSSDESLFAWPIPRAFSTGSAILAPRPEYFKYCDSISRLHIYKRDDYSVTNQGLKLHLQKHTAVWFQNFNPRRTVIIVPLNCGDNKSAIEKEFACTITLEEKHCGHYDRISGDGVDMKNLVLSRADLTQVDKTIYIHLPHSREACMGSIGNDSTRSRAVAGAPRLPKRVRTIVEDSVKDPVTESGRSKQKPPTSFQKSHVQDEDDAESEVEVDTAKKTEMHEREEDSRLHIFNSQQTGEQSIALKRRATSLHINFEAEYCQDYWAVGDSEVIETAVSTQVLNSTLIVRGIGIESHRRLGDAVELLDQERCRSPDRV